MPYDVAIVLGGGRDSNDTVNSRTVARLEKAVELFRSDVFARMILSGGISFSAPPGFNRSEASLMRDYMITQGIPDHVMLLEEVSTDTLGNAYFSKEQWLTTNGWKSVLVITSAFHVQRCRYLFGKVLGTDYAMDFAAAPDNNSREEAEQLDRLESHISGIYARWLDKLADGDSDAIRRVLFEHHPGHAPTPDFTREQLIELLYRNRR
jgi:uncharacterized SAM-binding protein YcdF (DUF218 family)